MGMTSLARKIAAAARKAKKAAEAAEKAAQKNLGGKGVTRGKPKDTPEAAEADRKGAATRAKERTRQENVRNTQSTSSINKNRNVSKADIMAANTAAMLSSMEKRIDGMDSGIRKKMMKDLLSAQKLKFKKEQSAEVDTMTRKQQQSASDRKKFTGYTPKSPFSKGGMAKMSYNKGGYVNCGASMPATQGKK